MDRSEKKALVSSLKKDFSESNLLIVTHYLGLNVNEIEKLRSKMRESNVKFKVIKNRITKLALPGTSFENVIELFNGPTAVAYSEDSVLAAKVAVDFSKSNKKLKIIGGSFEGKLINLEKVMFLASLPSLNDLRANFISLLRTPAVKIASVLKAPGNQVARVMNAYANANKTG